MQGIIQDGRTFAMLCSVGVPMIEALEVAGLVVHNYRMTKIAKELQDEVRNAEWYSIIEPHLPGGRKRRFGII